MKARAIKVMFIYAVLALFGAIFLTGNIRIALWIFLGGLAAKTMIVVASRRDED